jgi:hypothetical protein
MYDEKDRREQIEPKGHPFFHDPYASFPLPLHHGAAPAFNRKAKIFFHSVSSSMNTQKAAGINLSQQLVA